MLKQIVLIGFIVLISCKSYGQNEIPPFSTHQKNIYAEFLGSHLLVGVNFDMRLKKGRMDGIGFRAGIGGLSTTGFDQNTEINLGLVTFPIEFNHLVGKKRSSFVTGAGILPVYATFSSDGELTDYEFVREEGFGLVGGFFTMGYRFQPKETGLMFQFNWNPLILRGSGFHIGWLGIGLGIGFK
ncbi:hypothetical protein [Algoriphagus marincola]|uniref:hypothetical protein n=1 Tax=Algoriphagus marincola TaxID=264027 RepID=UPI00047C2B1C|nr:hypothetical protein [Algoriphagus marincola]